MVAQSLDSTVETMIVLSIVFFFIFRFLALNKIFKN